MNNMMNKMAGSESPRRRKNGDRDEFFDEALGIWIACQLFFPSDSGCYSGSDSSSDSGCSGD